MTESVDSELGYIRPVSPVTIVSPHLDDAVLSCWMLLASAKDLRVISCFAGIPQSNPEYMIARRDEDRAVFTTLGIPYIHLDHLDMPYRLASPAVTSHDLSVDLSSHLVDSDCVWLPMSIGRHPDHRLALHAGLRTAKKLGLGTVLYADLPYSARQGWPARVLRGSSRPAEALGSILRPTSWTPRGRELSWWRPVIRELCIGRISPVQVTALTKAQQAAKLAAISGYSSQLGILGYDKESHDRSVLLSYEAWWRYKTWRRG